MASYSDRHPVVYSLLSIIDGALELEILANNRKIDPAQLAEMKPISLSARDGTLLHGYLTIPPGKRGGALPLILHPHGGPWERDSWGYDPMVQFLASRGFAVMQVNFRSSAGYGYAFLHAGDKRWGTEMQDDLVDAVMWAVDAGITELGRIGIYGASYGGYAAMAQLVLHPDLYEFGIIGVGPVDLIGLINWRRKWKQESVYQFYTRTIGDPKTEGELLRRHSPINFVERIQAPVFIIHGTRDPRVPIDQAKRFRRELERHGKPYVWLGKKDEEHGFRKPENRIEQFHKMDAFLAPYR